MNIENREQIIKDFQRFSKLHSWYKHLSIDGSIFIFYLQKGQQFRYDFDKELTELDQDKDYWYFIRLDRNKKYIKELFDSGKELYWAKFGPFLRGIENAGESYQHFRGFHFIESRDLEKKKKYIEDKYPDIRLEKNFDIKNSSLIKIAELEYQSYLNDVLEFKKFIPDF